MLFAWFFFSRTLLGDIWESSSLINYLLKQLSNTRKNKRKRALEGTSPDKAGKKLKDKCKCITCHICEVTLC